jgi:hypothetical protein
VQSVDASQERVHIVAGVVARHSFREFIGFHRGRHALLEAAILATRFALLPPEMIKSEFEKLQVIIHKTGTEVEQQAMAELETLWQQHQAGQGLS